MLAFAHIITEWTRHKLALARHFLRGQSLAAEEAIDRVSSLEHLKLAGWIGPLVAFGSREQHRSRGAKGHQAILVERQPLRRIVELLELGIEPVWKMVVNGFHRFAGLPAAGRGAAAARLVRERDGDALVERRRQQGRLTIARVAQGCDAVRIRAGLSDQVVHATLEAPRPGGNRATVGGFVPGLIAACQPGVKALADVLAVGIYVPAIKRRQGVAAPDDFGQGPVSGLRAARGFSGGVVRTPLAPITHPT